MGVKSKVDGLDSNLMVCGDYTGGPTFGPVKYVKEVSHVEHMHADSILVHPNFSN